MTIYTVPARIVRVVDGDTLRVHLDLGWGIWLRDEPIRLAGINAPELRLPGGGLNPAGVAARDYLAELVAPAIAQGLLCGLVSTGFEKYGRALGYITVLGVGSLSQRMLDADHAVPYP